MAADCLENLSNLRQLGVNEETIRNVAGLVYFGKHISFHLFLNLGLTLVCSDGRYSSYLRILRE